MTVKMTPKRARKLLGRLRDEIKKGKGGGNPQSWRKTLTELLETHKSFRASERSLNANFVLGYLESVANDTKRFPKGHPSHPSQEAIAILAEFISKFRRLAGHS